MSCASKYEGNVTLTCNETGGWQEQGQCNMIGKYGPRDMCFYVAILRELLLLSWHSYYID